MLTVIEKVGRKHSYVLWQCLCDCGNVTTVISSNLVRGDTKSCGCLKWACRTREELEAHLLANRRITVDGCWEWTGAKKEGGYGIVGALALGFRLLRVPRLAAHLWFAFDLKSPLDICHRCDNPPCFNPDHLFPGMAMVNTHDSMAKGRWRTGQFQKQKTHCKRGHEFTIENTRAIRNGTGRECLACKRMYSRKSRVDTWASA